MITTKKLAEEIIEQLKTKDLVRIPASEDEYLSVAFDLPFNTEYHISEIITMGLATPWHEIIVMNLGRILNNLFLDHDDILVLGSSTGVHIPKFEGGYYMPDVNIVKGELNFNKNSKAIITNPYIIFEVLSPETQKFDLFDKFPEYKQLESLQQVVFISQKKMNVMVYIRQNNSKIWINEDFNNEADHIIVDKYTISLNDIYRKVKFEK